MIRAESLFRRFLRTVESIDKKQSFPAPKLRKRPAQVIADQAKGSTGQDTVENASGSTSGADAGPFPSTSKPAKGKGKGKASAEEDNRLPNTKIISPELRLLLSRKVEKLPRRVVKKGGEGLDSVRK